MWWHSFILALHQYWLHWLCKYVPNWFWEGALLQILSLSQNFKEKILRSTCRKFLVNVPPCLICQNKICCDYYATFDVTDYTYHCRHELCFKVLLLSNIVLMVLLWHVFYSERNHTYLFSLYVIVSLSNYVFLFQLASLFLGKKVMMIYWCLNEHWLWHKLCSICFLF